MDKLRHRFEFLQVLQTKHYIVIAIVLGIFIIGLISIGQIFGSWLTNLSRGVSGGKSTAVRSSEVLDIKKANFDYLTPSKDDAWTFDAKSPAFDKTTGVVKYTVILNYSQINATISQQKFPTDLQSRSSSKFANFISSSNPTRSQDVGNGTVYFMPALQNGAPANGSDTIIFATDKVLLFGRAERVIGYDAWVKMLGKMKPR